MLGLLGWTVLSRAACCFFRITSASFCLTTLLATAPTGVGDQERAGGGWAVASLPHCLATALSILAVRGRKRAGHPRLPRSLQTPTHIHRLRPASRRRPGPAWPPPQPSRPRAGHGPGPGRPPSLLRLLLSLLRSCRSSRSCCPTCSWGTGVSIGSCGQGRGKESGAELRVWGG